MLSGCVKSVERLEKSCGLFGYLCSKSTVCKKYLTSQVFLYIVVSTVYEQLYRLFAQPKKVIFTLLDPGLCSFTQLHIATNNLKGTNI